jgi:transcriptional regulator with XRE-family HTH domain
MTYPIEIRKYKKLSQKDFACKTMISPSTLSEVESKKINPSSALLVGIANAFDDINIEWLLTGNGEMFKSEESESARIRNLNLLIRELITAADIGITFAGSANDCMGQTIALVADNCVGEDLVRQLNEMNFVLDSGSACSASQMQPSHVLAALGMKSDGNLRITLHHCVTEAEVRELASAITSVVQQSR